MDSVSETLIEMTAGHGPEACIDAVGLEAHGNGEIDPTMVITHRLPLSDAAKGYEIFLDKEDRCETVVLSPRQAHQLRLAIQETTMILRIDKLAIELPMPAHPSPNSASAVQELLGGKFGEMSTLMNYTFQSFNFRGRDKMKPFYDLISNIAAEEYGHIELVSHTINMLLSGSTARGDDPSATPLEPATDARNQYHFIASGQTALPVDSMGNPWNGSYVFSSGNLKLDLLHNFFLECGARANKIRVYEMVDDPVAREMVGYLLVRGGTHIVAYAKALEVLSGVDVGKLLPIPDISNKRFPEAKKHEAKGLHQVMYRMSPDDYREISAIWRGPHPEDGSELRVVDGPPEGGPVPLHPEEPQLTSPIGPDGIDPGLLKDIGDRLFGKGSIKK